MSVTRLVLSNLQRRWVRASTNKINKKILTNKSNLFTSKHVQKTCSKSWPRYQCVMVDFVCSVTWSNQTNSCLFSWMWKRWSAQTIGIRQKTSNTNGKPISPRWRDIPCNWPRINRNKKYFHFDFWWKKTKNLANAESGTWNTNKAMVR